MPIWAWILIALAVAALVAIAVWAALRAKRSSGLRERFGPEYERTMETSDDRRRAESELMERERRREELEIKPLPAAERERFMEAWRSVQVRFVDAPVRALREADGLVSEVMRKRGYPMDEFEERAALVSVDHPDVVENYRAGHAVSTASEGGQASTEDLRRGMVHYRALFDELLAA
jgi:FtsZ-interacting cell division protein ZipA